MDRATLGASVEPAAAHSQAEARKLRLGLRERPVRRVHPLCAQATPSSFRSSPGPVQVPVHVFASADDPLIPVSNGEYLARQVPAAG